MQSSLSRTVARPQTPEWELHEFRRRAWKFDRTLCVKPDTVRDEWLRQALINLGNELYGGGK